MNERGFALPIVLILIALLSSFFLLCIKEWSEWKADDDLRLSMVQAAYAAESGIAYMQAKIAKNPDDYTTLEMKFGTCTTETSAWETNQNMLIIQSVAKVGDKVHQTKTAKVDMNTLQIKEWLE